MARDLVHSGLLPVGATLPWRYGRVVRLVRRGDVATVPAERLIAQVRAYRRLRRQGEAVPRLETRPDLD